MPKKCQVVRPRCMNLSLDVHECAVAYPFVPMPVGMFFTIGPTEWAVGDKQSAKVKQTGDGLIKLGHDCEYLRPHLFFPIPTPEVIMWLVHSATGSSETVWASFKTKHDDEPTALMFLDFDIGWMALLNQLNCGDLPVNPNVVSIQTPTNVYAGMSLGDVLACALRIIVEAALAWLVKKVQSKVSKWASKKLEGSAVARLAHKAERAIERSEKKVHTLLASKLVKAPLLRGLADKVLDQRQLRAAAQVLMRNAGDPMRHKLATEAVNKALMRTAGPVVDAAQDDAEEALASEAGDWLKDRYDLRVNPIELVVSPADALSELVAGDHSAHYDYVAALVDGRHATPPEEAHRER